MMSFRLLCGMKVAGVLNINQVDFSTKRSHFEHHLEDEVDVLIRSKRHVRNIVINPGKKSKILLTESFNDTSNLNENWDMIHMVEVVEEIIDDAHTSNSNNVSLSQGEEKKRGVDGALTPAMDKTLTPPMITVTSANDNILQENATFASIQGTFYSENKINVVCSSKIKIKCLISLIVKSLY